MFRSPGENVCPLLGKECIGAKCKLWVSLRGTNPQTGAELDKSDCSLAFLPLLLIENSLQQRQTGAAVESFRNEMVRANHQTLAALLTPPPSAAKPALAHDA